MELASLPTASILTHGQLPYEQLAAFAIREGRRPRPIYVAHKWFARRFGSVFRALLVGAITPEDSDFWNSYYQSANLQGFKVLDPFVGGGTSVVEAQRLGDSAFGVDIDPIACSITNLELSAAELPDLYGSLDHLQKHVGEAIRPFHSFTYQGQQVQVLHHFWVQVVTCHECGETFDVHPNFRLAKENGMQWVFCAQCGTVEQRWADHKTFKCGTCQHRTVIDEGRVDYGRAICPHCNHSETLIHHGRRTTLPKLLL